MQNMQKRLFFTVIGTHLLLLICSVFRLLLIYGNPLFFYAIIYYSFVKGMGWNEYGFTLVSAY
jgi:hypothetical protein